MNSLLPRLPYVALYVVHTITADIHELESDKTIMSVCCEPPVYTDDTSFRWTSPARSRSGTALLTSAAQVQKRLCLSVTEPFA